MTSCGDAGTSTSGRQSVSQERCSKSWTVDMILVLVDFFTGFDSCATSSASLFHLIHTTFKPWRLEHFLTNSDLLCYFSQWLVTRLHRLELQGLQFYWARLALTCLFGSSHLYTTPCQDLDMGQIWVVGTQVRSSSSVTQPNDVTSLFSTLL